MVETSQLAVANVIDLNERRGTYVPPTRNIEVEVRSYGIEDVRIARRDVQIEDLYAGDTPTAQLINRARQLLAEAEDFSVNAQRMLSEGDGVGADNEITLLQANLPELFFCRSLSEGLGAVTVALHHALTNRNGSPLTSDQIFAVRTACQKLHSNPFAPFTDALDLIDGLADAGLVTDPPEAELLSDFFVR
ncbi:MAG: hypothetical protein ABSD08_08205 [Xanthobacteraceae bacterium]|jgi:hypothetical protein